MLVCVWEGEREREREALLQSACLSTLAWTGFTFETVPVRTFLGIFEDVLSPQLQMAV